MVNVKSFIVLFLVLDQFFLQFKMIQFSKCFFSQFLENLFSTDCNVQSVGFSCCQEIFFCNL
jgi:hypothetical protein